MEEKYADVAGVRTRYLEAGQGEPLLLIHGGEYGRIANANAWDMAIGGFVREGFHVYAPDKIGNGFSDHPADESDLLIGTTVDHMLGFMKALGIERAHVAGHSRGGYTATRLAVDHPERVATLIVASSGTVMARFNPIYERWNEEVARIDDPREKVRHAIAANSFDPAHITDAYVDIHARIAARPETQATRRLMVAGARKRFIADVQEQQKILQRRIQDGALEAPTLVTWGLNDPSAVFDPVGVSAIQFFLAHAPRAEAHVFSRSGHYAFREQAAAFVDVIAGYIARSGGKDVPR